MIVEIDARGLSCPQPVLLFLNALKSGESDAYDVLVDTDASRENVTRAASNRGFKVEEMREKDGAFRLSIQKA